MRKLLSHLEGMLTVCFGHAIESQPFIRIEIFGLFHAPPGDDMSKENAKIPVYQAMPRVLQPREKVAQSATEGKRD